MVSPWRSELYWLIWLSLVGVFLGKLTGLFALSLVLCLVLYLGRHLYHIHQMLVWLRMGGPIPNGGGIWDEIFYLIYRLRRRNKRRKKRLLVLLERFRTATAALPDATVVLGPRDEIEWFNEAAERMMGLRKTDIGQQIVNLLRYPKFISFLKKSDYHVTVGIPSPASENLKLEIRVVPYGEDLRLLVAQDVTQLRFMERVRSDFVANVSHELRTPLTVLKGYIEALDQGNGNLPESYAKVFTRMAEQTTRMQNLIDGLLSLTRLESGPPPPQQTVDVGALLRRICDELSQLNEPQPELDLQISCDAKILGMEAELHSAFSNLISNALKYTQAGGWVKVRWADQNGGAKLEVEDNGPGIASEHLPRLTERFYRVELDEGPKKSGAGLGLAIVKHVLSRHDSEIKIRSLPGQGSCFSCAFPAKRLLRDSPEIAQGT